MATLNRREVMVLDVEYRQLCLRFYRVANYNSKKDLVNKLMYATLTMGLLETHYILDNACIRNL